MRVGTTNNTTVLRHCGRDREGLGGWSAIDIVDYLKTGRNRHLIAAGSMTDVITFSTSRMHDDDLAAIAAYLKELPPVTKQQMVPEPSAPTMKAGREGRPHAVP